MERQKKQALIEEEIFAHGFEKEDFLKILAKTKGILTFLPYLGLGPNVDFFSLQELADMSKKFKEEAALNSSHFAGGGAEEGKRDGTMADFFDNNINKLERGGTMSKKMTARRPTKRLEGTVLSR